MDHSSHQAPGPVHQYIPHRILPQTAEQRLILQNQVPPFRVKLNVPTVTIQVRQFQLCFLAVVPKVPLVEIDRHLHHLHVHSVFLLLLLYSLGFSLVQQFILPLGLVAILFIFVLLFPVRYLLGVFLLAVRKIVHDFVQISHPNVLEFIFLVFGEKFIEEVPSPEQVRPLFPSLIRIILLSAVLVFHKIVLISLLFSPSASRISMVGNSLNGGLGGPTLRQLLSLEHYFMIDLLLDNSAPFSLPHLISVLCKVVLAVQKQTFHQSRLSNSLFKG